MYPGNQGTHIQPNRIPLIYIKKFWMCNKNLKVIHQKACLYWCDNEFELKHLITKIQPCKHPSKLRCLCSASFYYKKKINVVNHLHFFCQIMSFQKVGTKLMKTYPVQIYPEGKFFSRQHFSFYLVILHFLTVMSCIIN